MRKIERFGIDALAEGAELAADIADGKGRTLVKAGTVLDARRIEQLGRMGVTLVAVFSAKELSAEEIESYRAETAERVEQLFSSAGDSPLAERLKQAVLEYRLEVVR